MDYKKLVAERIKEHVDLELENIEKLIEIPPKPEMGDFAFPCFQLAKVMRKAPNMIAAELAEKINKEGFDASYYYEGYNIYKSENLKR